MKIAILNDTHAGVRNDLQAMGEYQGRFYNEIFFPYLDEHDIKHIIHLGDYFDRRKFINFKSLATNKAHFIDPMIERGITMDLILGNHDTFYKNTNEINAPELLLFKHDNIKIVADPIVKEYDGFEIGLVPWICPDNYDRSIDFIKTSTATTLMGHFEIAGAIMMPGMACPHGLDFKLFDRYDSVLSGHFHHKSLQGNVRYLGSQMEFTWSDFGDEKHFHVFDTETAELSSVKNPLKMFNKVFYDDVEMKHEDLLSQDFSELQNTFVKVIIVNKENPYTFDLFMEKVNAENPVDLKVVDDNHHMDMLSDDDVSDAEDTLTILTKYVDSLEINGDKSKLDTLLKTLYNEALEQNNYL